MSGAPVLETERLRLRAFRLDDFETYARWCADAETTRYLGSGPMDREQAFRGLATLLGLWSLRGFGLWAAEEKASGALVGRIGLHLPLDSPGIEVAWLVDRDRWGEGFASEGARAAIRYGFETLRVTRLISLIRPGNAASIRVAEKVGEHFVGELERQGDRLDMYAIDAP